jgi:hypothetical protein
VAVADLVEVIDPLIDRTYHTAILHDGKMVLYWDGPLSWNDYTLDKTCSNVTLAGSSFVTICIAAGSETVVIGFTPIGFISVILLGGLVALQLLLFTA